MNTGAPSTDRKRGHITDLPDIPFATGPSYLGSDPTLIALSHALSDPRKLSALHELTGEHAQLLIDFLHTLLLQPGRAPPSLLEPAVITLYNLVKGADLFPQHYIVRPTDLVPDSNGLTLPRHGGRTGDVYEARLNGRHMCLKVMRVFGKSNLEAVLKFFGKEAILWGQLRHPNIVPFYGIYFWSSEVKRICLASPWMTNGNIVQYLEEEENAGMSRFPFIIDVASGLEYLHGEGVVHCDLKGENILVNEAGRACIADFGISCIRHDKTLSATITDTARGFTLRWAAPELLDGENVATRASDVWAFASVCYEILTRQEPYYEVSNDLDIQKRIEAGERPTWPRGDPKSELDTIDEKTWDLMLRCWAYEPENRPDCLQILKELGQSPASDYDPGLDEGVCLRNEIQKRQTPVDTVRVAQILHEL